MTEDDKEKETDIKEQLKKCSNCGLCKTICPTFFALLNETYSPRGKAFMIKKEDINEILYTCTLCKSCEINCPAGIKVAEIIRECRKKLVKDQKETEPNKKMVQNVREHGNPFGILDPNKKPKELYCC